MYLEPLTPAKNPKHNIPWWPRNFHSSTECRPSILLHKTEIKFIKKTKNTGKHTDCLAQGKPLPINAADYQLALIIRNPIYSGFFSVVVFLFLFSLFFSFANSGFLMLKFARETDIPPKPFHLQWNHPLSLMKNKSHSTGQRGKWVKIVSLSEN